MAFIFINPKVSGYFYLLLVYSNFYYQTALALGQYPSIESVIEFLAYHPNFLSPDVLAVIISQDQFDNFFLLVKNFNFGVNSSNEMAYAREILHFSSQYRDHYFD